MPLPSMYRPRSATAGTVVEIDNRVPRRARWPRSARAIAMSALPVLLCISASGCGTNIDDIVANSVGATGRTALDLLLTDLANNVADQFAGPRPNGVPEPADGGDGNDADGATSNGGADGAGLEDLIGDPDDGNTIFAGNGCGACHCADATGGCALDAPALLDARAPTLDDLLRGDAPHPGGKFDLSDQEIVDLEAFLASL